MILKAIFKEFFKTSNLNKLQQSLRDDLKEATRLMRS